MWTVEVLGGESLLVLLATWTSLPLPFAVPAAMVGSQVFKTVGKVHEASHGVILDAVAALEKDQPLGFDYRDVSMPVHVFHGRADHMVRRKTRWC